MIPIAIAVLFLFQLALFGVFLRAYRSGNAELRERMVFPIVAVAMANCLLGVLFYGS